MAKTKSQIGLTSKEAKHRLQQYGFNEIKLQSKTPLIIKFLEEFKDLMVIILIVAALIALISGESKEAFVILFIVLLNAIIGFIQKFRAEKAIEALKKLVSPTAIVIRNNKQIQIDAKEVVPGDIIVLQEGDKIPADATLIESNNFKTQEAPLTGESVAIPKGVSKEIFMGTDVAYGSGKAIVTKTGLNTEFGKIAKLTATTKKDSSPLEKELYRIGIFITKITLAISALLILIGVFIQGSSLVETFLFATSVAVAAVPEGLPATVTIALALGVQRLARKKAIVKQLSSVETLGSTTVICSDKTGTLTKNEMTVKKAILDNYDITIKGIGYKPEGSIHILCPDNKYVQISQKQKHDDIYFEKRKLEHVEEEHPRVFNLIKQSCKISTLCNNASLNIKNDKYEVIGDPTEGALITYSEKNGFRAKDLLSNHPKLYELPFDSVRKRMSVVCKNKQENTIEVLTKGAPDTLLDVCTHIIIGHKKVKLNKELREKILSDTTKMADKALRVIGLAYKEIKEQKKKYSEKEIESELIFVGLLGMIDPPRLEVKKAIDLAHKAGIKTYIITGDHALTAKAIATQINLVDPKKTELITGKQLNKINDKQLKKKLKNKKTDIIFARVNPEHKLRVVKALKDLGEIVAVTGDGVNDAPALKKADIGVAMGITGTDVSKEASNMILADDSFSTIIKAIREGRTIYKNLRKFIYYIFSCNIGELTTIFIALALNLPAPLTATLILAVDLGTDVLPALALGVEPTEPGIMKEKPRDPKQKIMTWPFIKRYLYVGLFIGVIVTGTFLYKLFEGGYVWGQQLGKDDPVYIKASTMAFVLLILIQMVNAYNARSEKCSIKKLGISSNLTLVGAIAISLIFTVLFVEVDFLNHFLNTTSLTIQEWALLIVLSFSVLIVEELRKFIVNVRTKPSKA